MKSVFIIAEAGVNHNGSYELALEMIRVAKEVGADAIKFQTAIPEEVISRYAKKAKYQEENTGKDESQLEMCKKLHFKFEAYKKLKKHCDEVGIEFLSTPFDIESVKFLDELGVRLFKIPSGEITNLPYLIEIARTGKEVILSTGMSNIEEIEQAVEVLEKNGSGSISLLHCTTEYPAPFESLNLRAIGTLSDRFGLQVGYSDHSLGIVASLGAVAVGAKIIEKHFTLDKTMEGPDHKASLEKEEFKALVRGIRELEKALGSPIKKAQEIELKNLEVARKSIVARRNIKKGEVFTVENITTKRPGTGLSPMRWFEVLGKIAERDFFEDEQVSFSEVE